MSKIITNVTSLIAQKLNKEYREVRSHLDNVDKQILELEIQLANHQKTKNYLQKKLDKLEESIVESLIHKSR